MTPLSGMASSSCNSARPVGTQLVEETSHQRGPARLVAGAATPSGVAMKVFVKEREIAPVRVLCETRIRPMARTLAVSIRQEESCKPGSGSRGCPLSGISEAPSNNVNALACITQSS